MVDDRTKGEVEPTEAWALWEQQEGNVKAREAEAAIVRVRERKRREEAIILEGRRKAAEAANRERRRKRTSSRDLFQTVRFTSAEYKMAQRCIRWAVVQGSLITVAFTVGFLLFFAVVFRVVVGSVIGGFFGG